MPITSILPGILAGALLLSHAMAQPGSASLTGVVFDPTNRLVPGTAVTLSDPAGARPARKTTSDAQGRYEFTDLVPGLYVVEVSQAGFRTVKSDAQVDGPTEQSFRLSVGSLRETITIWMNGDGSDGPSRGPGRAPADAPARERDTTIAQRCTGGRLGRVGGLILAPQKTRHVNPVYPDDMRAARQTGTVTLRGTIGLDGAVTGLTAVEASHMSFVTAAAAAVSQWRFLPTILDCEPVAVEMNVFLIFTRG